MKKTIRNHIDTITTCRLAEGLILERRVHRERHRPAGDAPAPPGGV